MQRRLKVKLLVVQLICLIPFLIFIFYILDLWYDTRRSMILENNIAKAKLTAMFVNNSLSNGFSIAKTLASDHLFQQTLVKDKENALAIIKDVITDTAELESLSVFNTNGEIVVTTLDLTAEQEKITLANKPYFQDVLKTKSKVVSTPIIGRYSGKYIVNLLVPILKNGEINYIISSAYEISDLKDQIEKIISDDDKKIIILLDQNRQVVFASNQQFPDTATKSLLTDSSFVTRAQEGEISIIENQTLPILNEKVIGAGAAVDSFDWVVLSIEPIKNVFSPLLTVQSVVWLIIFTALLFSISLISYFLRKVRIVY